MLQRMYLRWIEDHGFGYHAGEEASIKSDHQWADAWCLVICVRKRVCIVWYGTRLIRIAGILRLVDRGPAAVSLEEANLDIARV